MLVHHGDIVIVRLNSTKHCAQLAGRGARGQQNSAGSVLIKGKMIATGLIFFIYVFKSIVLNYVFKQLAATNVWTGFESLENRHAEFDHGVNLGNFFIYIYNNHSPYFCQFNVAFFILPQCVNSLSSIKKQLKKNIQVAEWNHTRHSGGEYSKVSFSIIYRVFFFLSILISTHFIILYFMSLQDAPHYVRSIIYMFSGAQERRWCTISSLEEFTLMGCFSPNNSWYNYPFYGENNIIPKKQLKVVYKHIKHV